MLRFGRSLLLVKLLLVRVAGKKICALESVGRPLLQFPALDHWESMAPVQIAGARRSSSCRSSRWARRRMGRRGPCFATEFRRNQRSNQFKDMADLLKSEDEDGRSGRHEGAAGWRSCRAGRTNRFLAANRGSFLKALAPILNATDTSMPPCFGASIRFGTEHETVHTAPWGRRSFFGQVQ